MILMIGRAGNPGTIRCTESMFQNIQNDIDWEKAKASGVSFAFIKATEGGDLADDRFRENWVAARRAGVPRGAYHFYYFCRPAFEQAAWYIQNVPKEKGALPPVLDMEWNHKSPTLQVQAGSRMPCAAKWAFSQSHEEPLRQDADCLYDH